jgi:hypothetical protein
MEPEDLDVESMIDWDDKDANEQLNQLKKMRGWFFENFEDPVHNCPYNGAEGGYQFIHGGPHSAEQKLREEFEGTVPEELIGKLAAKLSQGDDWSSIPSEGDPGAPA